MMINYFFAYDNTVKIDLGNEIIITEKVLKVLKKEIKRFPK